MLTQFEPNTERVTAVITSHLESGENFDGAIAIGVYPQNDAEIFIQASGVSSTCSSPTWTTCAASSSAPRGSPRSRSWATEEHHEQYTLAFR